MDKVLSGKEHLEEVETNDGKSLEVQSLARDELAEELANFVEVENCSGYGLGLTGSLAPCEELSKVA